MNKIISNIVFTKNRPLQLEAYLESLYKYFPSNLIKTYIIYKVELFSEEYEFVFKKFPNCIVIREQDFHNDFMNIVNQINTKYILFGVDDVVFFDTIDLSIIDETFNIDKENIFGFSLRFGQEIINNKKDIINEIFIRDQIIYYLDWTKGQTPNTCYPFELCATFYKTELVKDIINNQMNNNPMIRKVFLPNSILIKTARRFFSMRSTLKSFGFFFNPNTFESWNCRWCRNHSNKLPKRIYFQKLCASALQINMVNATKRKIFEDSDGYTIESLAQKYRHGYRLDIDYMSQNKPKGTHCGYEYLKLKK